MLYIFYISNQLLYIFCLFCCCWSSRSFVLHHTAHHCPSLVANSPFIIPNPINDLFFMWLMWWKWKQMRVCVGVRVAGCVCVYQHESSYMVKESFYLMRLYVAVYSKRCVVVADGWLGVYLPDACLGYAWLMICIWWVKETSSNE